jgi:hypothetical protein
MKLIYLVAPLGLALVASCASQHVPSAEQNAPLKVIRANTSMPFANLRHQIDDWVVRTDGSLLIKAASGRYYHATFFGPCPAVDFHSRIGFKTGAGGELDRYSSVLVENERCAFDSFDEVADPRAHPATPAPVSEPPPAAKS